MIRAFIAAAGFLGIIFFPPWFSLVCGIILAVRYRAWEVILMGLCMDLLWMPSGAWQIPYATLLAIFIVWALEPLRSELLNA